MNVFWLEQDANDLPENDDWLSSAELLVLGKLIFPKRHEDWRLGRWTAKRALAAHLGFSSDASVLSHIEVLAAPSGAPEAFIKGRSGDFCISLSHRERSAICFVAPHGVRLGCDLEIIEPRSKQFIADYFNREEQDLIRRASPADKFRFAALLWSAKESALKALQEGLRLDARSITVTPDSESCDVNGWSGLRTASGQGNAFLGWWWHRGRKVVTVVSDPAPDVPFNLADAACHHSVLRCA